MTMKYDNGLYLYDAYARCKHPTACKRVVEYTVQGMGTFLMWQHTLCEIHLELIQDPATEAAWRMGGLAAVRAMGDWIARLMENRWTLRLWWCENCRFYFQRTGFWYGGHEPGCTARAVEVIDGPVLAIWLLGGEHAVRATGVAIETRGRG